MRRHPAIRLGVIASIVASGCWTAAAQPPAEIDALVARVGQRVAEYYRRVQSLVCLEKSTVQPVRTNLSADGFARTVESDLRVEFEELDGQMLPAARVIRDTLRINGRAPREPDKKSRSGCTDPNPLSLEPLAFLLPEHRYEYVFTSLRTGREKDRSALIVDFVSVDRRSRAELVEDDRGHDDCFDWKGPIATAGRLWVDGQTHEVLRLDRRLAGPLEIRVSWKLQNRYNLPAWIVLERDDSTLRFKTVDFSDPAETLLLPESVESLTLVRNSLQSIRRVETFSGYRRFLTKGRVKE
jgi:hypothetical protein